MLTNTQITKALNAATVLFRKHYKLNKKKHKHKMRRRTYHFAFIFRRKRIVAVGVNKPHDFDSRTQYFGFRFNIPKYKEYCHAHAEIDALSKCWGKTIIDSNYTMVVVRLNSKGQLCDSKPCHDCQKIINQMTLKQIWWSNKDGTFECNNKKYLII